MVRRNVQSPMTSAEHKMDGSLLSRLAVGRDPTTWRTWQEVKAAVWQRANGRCEVCERLGGRYQHVVKRSQGGANLVSNVVLLCHRCHERTDFAFCDGRLVFRATEAGWEPTIVWKPNKWWPDPPEAA